MEMDAMNLLKQQMEDEKTARTDTLVQGTLKDFAQYRDICGQIQGLAVAQRLVGEMEIRLRRQQGD